jgi:phosphatidylserine decarboxylase
MSSNDASLLDQLKSWPLLILPHQLLSHMVRHATRWRSVWWKNPLIKQFIRRFDVDMSEATAVNAEDYADFNSFFTRALKPGARSFPQDLHAIASPVDGRISQIGDITDGQLIQAKGHNYSVNSLLGGDTEQAASFDNGKFATLYLSPRDYHRIHMPCQGKLLETSYVPGRLFSVAPHTTRVIPGLFARNERLVSLFETAAGPMALIMVGAIFVSCMETVWGGVVNPSMGMRQKRDRYDLKDSPVIDLARGDEMGRFNMGSTVILLFGQNRINWDKSLVAGTAVQLGQQLALLSEQGSER